MWGLGLVWGLGYTQQDQQRHRAAHGGEAVSACPSIARHRVSREHRHRVSREQTSSRWRPPTFVALILRANWLVPLTGRGRIIHEPGWLRPFFQDPLPWRHRVPEMIQATPPVPLGALRSPNILRDGQPVLTIPTNRGGRAAPLGDASDPLARLEHSPGSCDGPDPACR